MKTKEKNALRSKTLEELKAMLREAKETIFSLQLEKMHNKLKNTRSIFLKKKDIAKIMTIIRAKELQERMGVKSEKKNK